MAVGLKSCRSEFIRPKIQLFRHIYTFENLCKEASAISMGDETIKIFLNADGKMDDVSKELKAFLDYVARKNMNDTFVHEFDEAVKAAKQNREWSMSI